MDSPKVSAAVPAKDDLSWIAANILAYCVCVADKSGCINLTFQRLCLELAQCNIRCVTPTIKLNLLHLEKLGFLRKVGVTGAQPTSRPHMGTHYVYQLCHLADVLKVLDKRPHLPLEPGSMRIKAEELYRREKLREAV